MMATSAVPPGEDLKLDYIYELVTGPTFPVDYLNTFHIVPSSPVHFRHLASGEIDHAPAPFPPCGQPEAMGTIFRRLRRGRRRVQAPSHVVVRRETAVTRPTFEDEQAAG